nr:uncharacterized protein LOC109733179 [Aegilops tauschii subsp. strangulata]
MPDAEVVRLVNYISNCKLSEAEVLLLPPDESATMQILTPQPAADALEQGKKYLPDRSASDADDPDLGAVALEEGDATGGGGRSRAPLSLERSASSSEAREEREEAERQKVAAAKAAQEEADAVAKAQADASAKAQADVATKALADAAAKVQAEEAARGRGPQFIIPLRSAPPAPEIPAPTGGVGDNQPVMEREGGDAVILRTEVPQQALTAEAQGSQPDVPPTPPVGGELVVGATPVVRSLVHHCAAKATSALHPQEIGATSSSAPEAEATSAAHERANADLQQRLGEAQTALRAKEEECSKVAQERDRLAKNLADQADQHKAALQAAKDSEASLLAEFETERSVWAETEKALTDGYGAIEDMIDDFFPGYVVAANQAIEACRDEGRQAGAQIPPNAARSLGEQLLAVQARLQPAHRMLRPAGCRSPGDLRPLARHLGSAHP